ncbi:hypothetical protein REMIM1_CH01039 [Rhizobium etli bv. mimosae str. Mim1]|nr:hypothetical protein REMIM1_CH01039 [Rhizobium etli bv. mimosae str. Mim1]
MADLDCLMVRCRYKRHRADRNNLLSDVARCRASRAAPGVHRGYPDHPDSLRTKTLAPVDSNEAAEEALKRKGGQEKLTKPDWLERRKRTGNFRYS